VDVALDALSIVGRIFYGNRMEYININLIASEAKVLLAKWMDSDLTLPKQMEEAFELLDCESSRSKILSTVYHSDTSGEEWMPSHDIWQDLLVARYLALCEKGRVIEELSLFGYLPHVTILASGLMTRINKDSRVIVDPAFINKATQLSIDRKNILYVCNLFALYAWNSQAVYEGDAFMAYERALVARGMPSFARLFIMNTLAARCVAYYFNPNTPKVVKGVWQEATISALWTYLKSDERDPLTDHQAGCYLSILESSVHDLSNFLNLDKLKTQVTFLNEAMVPHIQKSEDAIQKMKDTIQKSLCEVVRLMNVEEQKEEEKTYIYCVRRIPAVHYIYVLTVFYINNHWVEDTKKLLYEVFKDKPIYEELLLQERNNTYKRECPKLPALCELFKLSKSMYNRKSTH
jgi:hypothetical protein